MNVTGKRMLDILKELRDGCGAIAVKAEFEAEGSRTDEMFMLCEIVYRADMRLTIKIGGCEAVRDLDQCRLFGASGIMAPMIESPFAMEKFKGAAEKVYGDAIDGIDWIINTETKTCHLHLGEILDSGKGFLKTVTIGRSDLSASMGLPHSHINDEAMLAVAVDMADRARSRGLSVGFGGRISLDSIPFISGMASHADRFETRKVVLRVDDDEKVLRRGILLALEFEMLYLKGKRSFYDRMANEDKARVARLSEWLERAK